MTFKIFHPQALVKSNLNQVQTEQCLKVTSRCLEQQPCLIKQLSFGNLFTLAFQERNFTVNFHISLHF